MPMTIGQFLPLFKKGLSDVTINAYDAVDPMWKEFFNQGTMSELELVTAQMAGLGRFDRFRTGEVPAPDSLTMGFLVRFPFIKYGKIVEIDEDAVLNEQYGILTKEYAAQMGEAAVRRQEVEAAKIFNAGFTDAGPDGVSLFNTAHPFIRPRYGQTTWANRASVDASLSATALKAAIIIYQRMRNEEVEFINERPAKLVVPIELQWDAQEILNSTMSVENTSANFPKVTTTNVLKSIVEPKAWSYLTSTTAWFLTGETSKTGMQFYRRYALRRKFNQDFKTDMFQYKASEAYVFGYKNSRRMWGSAPV